MTAGMLLKVGADACTGAGKKGRSKRRANKQNTTFKFTHCKTLLVDLA
jgi:hypothetical protein